jgi:hypothetical protein
MKFEEFNVEERDDKILVFIKIKHRTKRNAQPKMQVKAEDISSELLKRGIDHGKVLQEAIIKNYREDSRQGTWIFEKKKEKVLDKPAEKVILSKEKKAAPKKKSKAKKKTSK